MGTKTVYLNQYCEGVVAQICGQGARSTSDAIRRCIAFWAEHHPDAAADGELEAQPSWAQTERATRQAAKQAQQTEVAARRAKVDLRRVLDPQARAAMRVWVETGTFPDQRTVARCSSPVVLACFGEQWQRWRDCSSEAIKLRDDTPAWKAPPPPAPKQERCEHGMLDSEPCAHCDGAA